MKHGTRWIIITLTLIVVGLLVAVAYLLWQQPNRIEDNKSAVTSFESCVAAGNSVMETQPRQCRDDESGAIYTEKDKADQPAKLETQTYKSVKGVTITINDWADDREVSSPLTITGTVPGSWSFEGTFPIGITYQDDIGLPGTTAKLDGDWMTDKPVPFKATLEFDQKKLAGDEMTIMLRQANPSGMPENDDSLALKVRVAE